MDRKEAFMYAYNAIKQDAERIQITLSYCVILGYQKDPDTIAIEIVGREG